MASNVTVNSRQGRGARRNRGRGRGSPMISEINVTPFVDVMLVLLIIFMISAPLLNTVIPVELPKTASTTASSDETPLTITVNAQGHIYLHDNQYTLPTLTTKLNEIAQDGLDRVVYLRGDKATNFGRIGEVMGLLIQTGFTKVTFPTLPTSNLHGQDLTN